MMRIIASVLLLAVAAQAQVLPPFNAGAGGSCPCYCVAPGIPQGLCVPSAAFCTSNGAAGATCNAQYSTAASKALKCPDDMICPGGNALFRLASYALSRMFVLNLETQNLAFLGEPNHVLFLDPPDGILYPPRGIGIWWCDMQQKDYDAMPPLLITMVMENRKNWRPQWSEGNQFGTNGLIDIVKLYPGDNCVVYGHTGVDRSSFSALAMSDLPADASLVSSDRDDTRTLHTKIADCKDLSATHFFLWRQTRENLIFGMEDSEEIQELCEKEGERLGFPDMCKGLLVPGDPNSDVNRQKNGGIMVDIHFTSSDFEIPPAMWDYYNNYDIDNHVPLIRHHRLVFPPRN